MTTFLVKLSRIQFFHIRPYIPYIGKNLNRLSTHLYLVCCGGHAFHSLKRQCLSRLIHTIYKANGLLKKVSLYSVSFKYWFGKKAKDNIGLLTNTKDGYINAEFYLTEKQNKLQSLGPIVLICHHHQQTIITCLLNL